MEQSQYNQLFSFIFHTEFCRNYLDNPDFMNFINQRVFTQAYENANK